MDFDNLFKSSEKEGNNSKAGNNTTSELINIQNVVDNHARYKMPKLQSRIKDKGKFAETFVSNLPDIAKSLKISLASIIKFIELNLGSQFLLADKNDLSSYYIKGRFSYEQLYEPLRLFIDQYVLCHKCGLPELEYVTHKSAFMRRNCKSCGDSVKVDIKDKIYKLFKTEVQLN